MRLINTSDFSLVEFHEPPDRYAILSHTWGAEEVSHAQYCTLTEKTKSKTGYAKIEHLCRQAASEDYEYAWIDTVCIDKTSSAELTEAINSMYAWYARAEACYAHLEDIDELEEFPESRWLTRGWTLQELLAPEEVRFYGRGWNLLGTKAQLAERISMWTGIDAAVLRSRSTMSQFSIATRMHWAAERETSRVEDLAYCLMGIFQVNMPLLYGEGMAAFARLQEEILRKSNDMSILTWVSDDPHTWHNSGHYLAPSPSDFQLDRRVIPVSFETDCLQPIRLGMNIKVQLHTEVILENQYWHRSLCTENMCVCNSRNETTRTITWATLNCRFEGSLRDLVGIEVVKTGNDWSRVCHRGSVRSIAADVSQAPKQWITLRKTESKRAQGTFWRSICMITMDEWTRDHFSVAHFPSTQGFCWNPEERISEMYVPFEDAKREFILFSKKYNKALGIGVSCRRRLGRVCCASYRSAIISERRVELAGKMATAQIENPHTRPQTTSEWKEEMGACIGTWFSKRGEWNCGKHVSNVNETCRVHFKDKECCAAYEDPGESSTTLRSMSDKDWKYVVALHEQDIMNTRVWVLDVRCKYKRAAENDLTVIE